MHRSSCTMQHLTSLVQLMSLSTMIGSSIYFLQMTSLCSYGDKLHCVHTTHSLVTLTTLESTVTPRTQTPGSYSEETVAMETWGESPTSCEDFPGLGFLSFEGNNETQEGCFSEAEWNQLSEEGCSWSWLMLTINLMNELILWVPLFPAHFLVYL